MAIIYGQKDFPAEKLIKIF